MGLTPRSLSVACAWALLASASPLALVGEAAYAQSSAEEVHTFDIESQPLATALTEFGQQANMQMLFAYEHMRDLNAPAVIGTFSRQEALRRLLAGSGLAASFDRNIVRLARLDASNSSGIPTPSTELVVTGTRIRGAPPVGSQVVTLDRTEIAESGASTGEELLRTLPQAFGGGFAQHISFQGGNFGGGSGVNLRGLGPDATLSLVNGRRIPAIGSRGSFADVSLIPVSAIERIEVLPDSASAIYGSDAVGGVVNFILRDKSDGFELGVRHGGVTKGDLRETRVTGSAGATFGDIALFAAFEHLQRSVLAMADRRYLADSDLRPLGGANFDLTRSNPTTLLVSGLGSYAVPFGQDGRNLREADLLAGSAYTANANEGLDALPAQAQDALFLSARWDVLPTLELFAEARLAQRSYEARNGHTSSRITIPATNAFRAVNNLFSGRTVQADYDFYRDIGPRTDIGDVHLIDLSGGLRLRVSENWTLEPALAYARFGGEHTIRNLLNTTQLNAALASSDPTVAFNPFGDGSFTNPDTLRRIRGYTSRDIISEVWSIAFKADGVALQLPAGALRVAVGVDYRNEFFELDGEQFVSGAAPVAVLSTSNDRQVSAVFVETLIPIFGETSPPPLGQRVDLSIAARHERYSDFGETTNPKLGLLWTLSDAFRLRASYGHAFRAPNLVDVDPEATANTRQVRALTLPDPVAPSGTSQVLFFLGANQDLREQTATSWTAGFDFEPNRARGPRLNMSYFEVEFRDRISAISNIGAALFPDSEFSSLVNRSPDPALVAALLAEATALGSSGGFSVADIDVVMDARATNLARTEVRGVDFNTAYRWEIGADTLEARLDLTYLLEYSKAGSPTAASRDLVSTVDNPIDLNLRAGLSWRGGPLSLAGFVNYANSYDDRLSIPNRRISSWTTVDLSAGIALPTSDLSRDTRLILSVRNLFDDDPPFVNYPMGFGYDQSNAHPLGRFVALELTAKF